MKPITMKPITMKRINKKSGFALVATMSILIFLILIALAMLSLSTTITRSGRQTGAQAEAEANARLALMLAIGELQKQMGPDQRISANGDILSHITVNHPHWMGSWDSWKAGDSSSDNPDGFSGHSTIVGVSDQNMSSTYEPGREDHFRSWLVSMSPSLAADMSAISMVLDGASNKPGENAKAVKLVGKGSVVSDDDHVVVPLLTQVSQTGVVNGRYGYWVGDQNQKALLAEDSYNQTGSMTTAERIYRGQAPGSTGIKRISGLENMSDESELAKVLTMQTVDLLSTNSVSGIPSTSKVNFHAITDSSLGVLADVREGGLKRDLSVLLERPISLEETGDEHMLYRFSDDDYDGDGEGEQRVPIQDLAAYYQLYQNDPSWDQNRRGGVTYDSPELADAIQIASPTNDFHMKNQLEQVRREYTGLYRNPVPVKVQFLLAVGGREISPEERLEYESQTPALRPTDKYWLKLGIMPVVTLWNPNNVPLVMNRESSQVLKMTVPPFGMSWTKHRANGQDYRKGWFNLSYAMGESTSDGRAYRGGGGKIISLRLGYKKPIVFNPGEVKMFSIPIEEDHRLSDGVIDGGNYSKTQDAVSGWNPYGFYTLANAATGKRGPEVFGLPGGLKHMVFGDGDKINFEIKPESATDDNGKRAPIGLRPSIMSDVYGAGFNLYFLDEHLNEGKFHQFRRQILMSRYGGGSNYNADGNCDFNGELMHKGFPDGELSIPRLPEIDAIPAADIVGASRNGEVYAIAQFSLMTACEGHADTTDGYAAGRNTTTRPFLHGSSLSHEFMDQSGDNAAYDHGWNWTIDRINSVEEAVQSDPLSDQGFYGAGHTPEKGVSHVVQQEIPLMPLMSIASLSHAHLGGYSLANRQNASNHLFFRQHASKNGALRSPSRGGYYRVTANGQGGLGPNTLQAIGNAYGHPNISSDKAFKMINREYRIRAEAEPEVRAYVDHSYLANKALWDDYYFSSLSPKIAAVEVYEQGASQTVEDVAKSFFIDDEPLPNRRMVAYKARLNEDVLDSMLLKKNDYEYGLADQIAKHLMVSGSFNVNSTSVEAWKIVLSSLRGKPVAYLADKKDVAEFIPDGTPVSPMNLTNALPILSADLSEDPNVPEDQWRAGRILTDEEIDELAQAVVKQVKLRGPFLSLSEFVNRRLDSSNTELSVKGALQAAIDDPSVSINAAFRQPGRMLDGEPHAMTPDFPEALAGPIAYGSAAYIDQADVLRNFASVLTPRGDTFVIRTYGDSLDTDGTVLARAWCEAVVQRVPCYLDASDSSEIKQNDLQSITNKRFGRRFKIAKFRWLNADEL
jgi:type II secretory pathway pseudopilin PulG